MTSTKEKKLFVITVSKREWGKEIDLTKHTGLIVPQEWTIFQMEKVELIKDGKELLIALILEKK